jgi:hypothetical protein
MSTKNNQNEYLTLNENYPLITVLIFNKLVIYRTSFPSIELYPSESSTITYVKNKDEEIKMLEKSLHHFVIHQPNVLIYCC